MAWLKSADNGAIATGSTEDLLDELRKINCNQMLIINELKLLNIRTEEAFQTGLNEGDLT